MVRQLKIHGTTIGHWDIHCPTIRQLEIHCPAIKQYRNYFEWHGLNRKEASYVEKMISLYGSDFIMKNMGYQEDWSSDGSC